MMTTPIELLWAELMAAGAAAGQRRIDASHPHDIYADLSGDDRPGLVILTNTRPREPEPLRSLAIERGSRADGRWTLHLSLIEPSLITVFAALATDIVDATRSGVDDDALAGAVMMRIERWRTLLMRDRAGLEETKLRGLIGELHVLETRVLAHCSPLEAITGWTGPDGDDQDFLLVDGLRLEVKAVSPGADDVRINGLGQLDTTGGPIELVVVRMQRTGAQAPGRVNAPDQIARLRMRLAIEPAALTAFDDRLRLLLWHDHPAHAEFSVIISGVETYSVDDGFPRLTSASVPQGIVEADYVIQLPAAPAAS
jgi:hypothetical protein